MGGAGAPAAVGTPAAAALVASGRAWLRAVAPAGRLP